MAGPEATTQISIVEYLRLKKILCFAVPNGSLLGGRNNWALMNSLKAQGLTPGVSDLIIVTKKELLFVEVKIPTGKQSDHQKDFEKQVKALGYKYLVWRSVDDAINYPF